MKHSIDPTAPIMGQLRALGIPEHLPVEQSMLYRFYGEADRLLYVGVTVAPRGRWQAHKTRAPWWSDVRSVHVELHPHERAALDAEVVAIKAELPAFNRRSAPAALVQSSCAAHEFRVRPSFAILPRVGGGVGGRGEDVVTHASCLTDGPVDNSAAASALPTRQARCNAFGEIGRWVR